MYGLSRGVSTKAALRLFVVTLCVLITLLMAILNYVSFFFPYDGLAQAFLYLTHHLFSPYKGFLTWEQLHSNYQPDGARGSPTLHWSCEFIGKDTSDKILFILCAKKAY